jgi:hypothetical protein
MRSFLHHPGSLAAFSLSLYASMRCRYNVVNLDSQMADRERASRGRAGAELLAGQSAVARLAVVHDAIIRWAT